MTEIRQNLNAKTEETVNVTESFFYILKKSGTTWLDRKVKSTNLLKFLFDVFLANESELSYTGDEKISAKDTNHGYVTVNGINLYNFTALEFDNSDLVDFTLTVTHNKNSRQVEVWYYDNNWVKQSLDGLLTLNTANAFSINFGMDITGTHTIYYKFF